MSKSVRRFFSFLLVLQLIIPYPTFAAAIGEFTSVVGGVTQTRVKEVIRPVAKSPIQLKDIIVTDQASSAMMVFSDDSTIKLEQNTKLEIKEFLFKEKSRTGIFSLAIGKMTASVNKFIGGDNVFEVHSVTAIAGVRGTGFEFIESKVGDKTTATVNCTEGSLTISALSPLGVIIATSVIVAGQTAVISGGIITITATIAGTDGTAGTGTVAEAGAGTAAAAGAGLSTGATIGMVAGALALAGGGAALVADRSSSDSSSGGEGGTGGTGGTGDVKVTLTWSGTDDLDLYVTDPCSSTIFYGSRTAVCQGFTGQLDIDSNANCLTTSPSGIENIYWGTGAAPRGTFNVVVKKYPCGGTGSSPFTVTVLKDGNTQTYSGTVTYGSEVNVTSFTR
jgi:hypothetical protein